MRKSVKLRFVEVYMLNKQITTKIRRMVKKRVTVTIDREFDEKIRQMQVDFITKSNKSWSYSSVLSMIIGEGIMALNQRPKSAKNEKASRKRGD